jgi:hypothetical protein
VFEVTLRSFLLNEVNKSTYVTPTRLDRTLKALINRFTKELKKIPKEESIEEESSYFRANDLYTLIDYINKLRIHYFFRRLEYRKREKAKELRSKSLLYLLSTLTYFT